MRCAMCACTFYTHGVCGCTVGQLQELFAAVNAGDDDSEIRRHKGTQAAAAGSSVGKQFVDLLDIKEFEALLVRLSIRLDATRLARLRCVAATCACCLRVLPVCVARGLTVATGGYLTGCNGSRKTRRTRPLGTTRWRWRQRMRYASCLGV